MAKAKASENELRAFFARAARTVKRDDPHIAAAVQRDAERRQAAQNAAVCRGLLRDHERGVHRLGEYALRAVQHSLDMATAVIEHRDAPPAVREEYHGGTGTAPRVTITRRG